MLADLKHVKELFLAATDLPVAGGSAFLDGAWGGDAKHLTAIERLLEDIDLPLTSAGMVLSKKTERCVK